VVFGRTASVGQYPARAVCRVTFRNPLYEGRRGAGRRRIWVALRPRPSVAATLVRTKEAMS